MWENKISECQIRGWKAVSAAGLHGQGLHKRNVHFSDTGMRVAAVGIEEPRMPRFSVACLTRSYNLRGLS